MSTGGFGMSPRSSIFEESNVAEYLPVYILVSSAYEYDPLKIRNGLAVAPRNMLFYSIDLSATRDFATSRRQAV
jgi:hypothetical protein